VLVFGEQLPIPTAQGDIGGGARRAGR
jgi:hypothetical protein